MSLPDNMADLLRIQGDHRRGVYGPIASAGVKLRAIDRTLGEFLHHPPAVQPVINVAADADCQRACACSRRRQRHDPDRIGGTYENTAVRERQWKLAQDLHHSFNASYRNGWARLAKARGNPEGKPACRAMRAVADHAGPGGAASAPKFSAEFPPDHPIRSRQYSFPEIVEPAFHYVNPVSGRKPGELLP
jgi:hypothetical protein